jgi:hypothetical protein
MGFKVGDKVVINPESNYFGGERQLPEDKWGTVSKIKTTGVHTYVVNWDDKHNDYREEDLLPYIGMGAKSDGFPTNAQERKDTPVYAGVLNYFPLALLEVAKCSKAGNDQHNAGQPLHWCREKSGDELDALTRHLLQAGTIDTDGMRHSAKVAWRALANLQKELEDALNE